MDNSKLRRGIAFEAARLLYDRHESEITRAKIKAARKVCSDWVRPRDLPTNREIRALIQDFARLQEGPPGEMAGLDWDESAVEEEVDRFQIYKMLLLPLETVQQSRERHPEGDALYHSLQVFDLAREELPYDEEFLLAALLHDVGKAIDPYDHVRVGLAALEEVTTERTRWFIEHHAAAHALREGTLGHRARQRLEQSPDYEELKLLSQCDRQGRVRGYVVPEVDEALDYLRELARMCE